MYRVLPRAVYGQQFNTHLFLRKRKQLPITRLQLKKKKIETTVVLEPTHGVRKVVFSVVSVSEDKLEERSSPYIPSALVSPPPPPPQYRALTPFLSFKDPVPHSTEMR